MRWLLLVLAVGCAAEDEWRHEFDGAFRVTSYAIDTDSCAAVTAAVPPGIYLQFGHEPGTARTVRWCASADDCTPFGESLVLEPDGDGLSGTSAIVTHTDPAPMTTDPSMCLLQFGESHAVRTSEEDVRVEHVSYDLLRRLDDSCSEDHAVDAKALGHCTISSLLTATRSGTH